jgi:hypothetical protein
MVISQRNALIRRVELGHTASTETHLGHPFRRAAHSCCLIDHERTSGGRSRWPPRSTARTPDGRNWVAGTTRTGVEMGGQLGCGGVEAEGVSGRNPRNRRLLVTTKIDDNAIAAPAMMGLSRPVAASGIAAML